MHLWAGGGIVADSDPKEEYQETYHSRRTAGSVAADAQRRK